MPEVDPSLDARYLEIFPAYLRSLGADATALGSVVTSDAPEGVRRYAIAGLNYIFKSLDLIPDGIDDLGFLDDAFVLRVAASLALADSGGEAQPDPLSALARDAEQIESFLGDVYPRLVNYVKNLLRGAARGRTVDEVIADAGVRDTFLHEVAAWAGDYQVPPFTRDVKTLIKLKAFLNAKLS